MKSDRRPPFETGIYIPLVNPVIYLYTWLHILQLPSLGELLGPTGGWVWVVINMWLLRLSPIEDNSNPHETHCTLSLG